MDGIVLTRVVQTTLEDPEYKALRDALRRRGETLRGGLRRAILRFIEEETVIDPEDPIFDMPGKGGSGKGDLAQRHDAYVYEKE
jgi:hypothetical protein